MTKKAAAPILIAAIVLGLLTAWTISDRQERICRSLGGDVKDSLTTWGTCVNVNQDMYNLFMGKKQ